MKPFLRAGFWLGIVGVVFLAGYLGVLFLVESPNLWLLYGLLSATIGTFGASVGLLFVMMRKTKERGRRADGERYE